MTFQKDTCKSIRCGSERWHWSISEQVAILKWRGKAHFESNRRPVGALTSAWARPLFGTRSRPSQSRLPALGLTQPYNLSATLRPFFLFISSVVNGIGIGEHQVESSTNRKSRDWLTSALFPVLGQQTQIGYPLTLVRSSWVDWLPTCYIWVLLYNYTSHIIIIIIIIALISIYIKRSNLELDCSTRICSLWCEASRDLWHRVDSSGKTLLIALSSKVQLYGTSALTLSLFFLAALESELSTLDRVTEEEGKRDEKNSSS